MKDALKCSVNRVFERLFDKAKTRVNSSAEHREFKVKGCLFIAQLSSPEESDELWFIASSSPDPRTLYVNFSTVAEREQFEQIARRLGYRDDKELGLELVQDFMKKFRL